MLGIHLTEQEHALAKELAAREGEAVSVMFRAWLREQAKRIGLAVPTRA
ncbi:MAG: hypothetical protein HOO96_14030 [Polyangiaceae bacterium]|nr:hypothetical protein [Polyangiaceae bacterium]